MACRLVTEQLPRFLANRPRESFNIREADVAFTSLDAANIGAMEPAFFGEALLRQPGMLTRSSKISGEQFD